MDIWKEIKLTLIKVKPVIFSHHPSCSFFKADTIRICSIDLCIGCFMSYPIALLILLLDFTFSWSEITPQVFWQGDILLFAGLAIGSLQFISSFRGINNKMIKIIIKIALGVGIGFSVIGIFALPISLYIRVSILLTGMTLAVFFGSFRLYRVRSKCASCIFHGDWNNCYGFRSMNDYVNGKTNSNDFKNRYGINSLFSSREPRLFSKQKWLTYSEEYDLPWFPQKYYYDKKFLK